MATADADVSDLSPEEALARIDEIDQVHDALERRTSGLTWMVWGLVIPAIFVTYNYWGVVVEAFSPEAAPLFSVLWIPWAVLGGVVTWALWRSAGLVLPGIPQGSLIAKSSALIGVFVCAAVGVGINELIARTTGVFLVETAVMLLAVGFVSLLLAATGWLCTDVLERRLWLAAGVFQIAVAVGGTVWLQGNLDLAYAWFSLLGPVSSVIAYFGGGLYLTTRG